MIPIQHALRRRMMKYAGILPSGYTQVDYIQGTGSQYIDTGFLVNKSDNYTLEIDAQFNASSSKVFQGANGYMQMYITAKYGIRSDGVSVGNRDLIVIGYANNIETLTINGVVQETHDWTTEHSGVDEKLGVFRMGNTNNSWFSGTIATGKLYGYKVWKDGILVSECIPCLRNSDSAVGLYDIVLKQFVENAGTGVFGYYITPVLPFGLKYTGDFSVETVDGAKIVTLLSSGTLTVTRSITAEVYMLAGGGGAAYIRGYWTTACSGGGGGYDTFETALEPDDYPITIGIGGIAKNDAESVSNKLTGGTGGDTIAFGRTCTGGTGSTAGSTAVSAPSVGKGGYPNGEDGKKESVSGYNPKTVSGGAPNGGKLEVIRSADQQAYSGGNGYITLTIPI